MKLNNFDKEIFLNEFWQKKPLVIRHAFEEPFWLEPDDLAGLSCEEEVESRIISQTDKIWKVELGPFDSSRFSSLPEKDWTLLVQAVDQWVPEVKSILSAFDFLPAWRRDDIMVSYAPIGGTVSQHYDFFDVFLIQGEGRRRWQIGGVCGSQSELVPDTSVRILKEFNCEMEVILNPGDMLYIPARHSHLGVSVENSLTYSVGFKAPSIRDIVDGVATSALETLLDDVRYRDTKDTLSAGYGEVSASVIARLKGLLSEAMLDDDNILSWFGQYVTERKYPELDIEPELEEASCIEGWFERLKAGGVLYKNPSSRFAYSTLGASSLKTCKLFIDGEAYSVEPKLAGLLSDFDELDSAKLTVLMAYPENRRFIESLLLKGSLYLDDDG